MNDKALTIRDQNYGIAELTRAEELLATVEAIPDAKKIADAADALRMYMKKADLGLANQNRAAAIATKARRKAGEDATGIERKLGGRPGKTTRADSGSSTPLQSARESAGVSEDTLEAWQQLSREHTDADIDAAAAEATVNGREFTTAQMIQREKAREVLAKIQEELKRPFAGFDIYLDELQQELLRKYPDPEAAFLGTPAKLRKKSRGQTIKSLCDWFDKLRTTYEQHC